MDRPAPLALADGIAAAQAWWREAGVDHAYLDTPRAWLTPEAADRTDPVAQAPPPLAEAPAPPRIGGDPALWPQELAAFARWWLEEPSLDPGGLHPRIPPRGSASASLMILVPMPEAEDSDTLLSGPHGRLVAGMLRAMGIPPEQSYLAAALPRHLALPDWAALAAGGLGEVLRHHVTLAAPKRLLVLGRDILPLLEHDPAQGPHAVSEMSILSGKLPMLRSYAPGSLLDHAGRRAELWRRWLDWTGTSQ